MSETSEVQSRNQVLRVMTLRGPEYCPERYDVNESKRTGGCYHCDKSYQKYTISVNKNVYFSLIAPLFLSMIFEAWAKSIFTEGHGISHGANSVVPFSSSG
jgi:hypothetical protein